MEERKPPKLLTWVRFLQVVPNFMVEWLTHARWSRVPKGRILRTWVEVPSSTFYGTIAKKPRRWIANPDTLVQIQLVPIFVNNLQ